MADGSWLMAQPDSTMTMAISHQPSAMTDEAIRDLMWQSVGLFRSREGLQRAVAMLDAAYAADHPQSVDGCRHRNLTTVARLIARAALRREESRGGHFRADFPGRDDRRWRIHVVDAIGAA
jgi:succinate dehydrogenase/fumarate reductase flavoprotein subunit